MRRYAADGTEPGYAAAAQLLASAPSAQERQRLLAALNQGLQERPRGSRASLGTLFAGQAVIERPSEPRPGPVDRISPLLDKQIAALWRDDTTDGTLIAVAARLGRTAAHERAVQRAIDPRAPQADRIAMLQLLADVGQPRAVGALLALLLAREPEAVQAAALDVLQRFEQDEIGTTLLGQYPRMSSKLRARTAEVLLGRKSWARAILQAIDAGRIAAQEVPVESLRVVALHRDRSLDDLVRKHWGNIQPGTPEEKLAEMRRLSNDLRAGSGDPVRGRELFHKHCATCHKLFGQGEPTAPDLTHANRKDRDYLLASIVDPSAVIRREHLSYTVQTTDGRFLTGLVVEQTPGSVTLINTKHERTRIARDKIESMEESPVSLMPENLLKELKPQELRDLFSYLQADGPPLSRR
jgi:putative heme-binding domain-containing protein